jgi:hypothetical protein
MSDQHKLLDRLIKDMEPPNYGALYHQLGRLRADMPLPSKLGQREATTWVGRAIALIEAVPGCGVELATLRAQVLGFNFGTGPAEATAVATIIDTVMAKVELKLPAQAQGAFIPAGGVFDGFQAVAKAVGSAQHYALLVDPYADDTLIADFAPLAPEGVHILVLSDDGTAKPSLKPAAERWIAQYQQARPLQVRLAAARTLHDRIIITDESVAWVVGQSFRDLAKRAHTSLVRMDPESAALKISAYKAIWQSSAKLA